MSGSLDLRELHFCKYTARSIRGNLYFVNVRLTRFERVFSAMILLVRWRSLDFSCMRERAVIDAEEFRVRLADDRISAACKQATFLFDCFLHADACSFILASANGLSVLFAKLSFRQIIFKHFSSHIFKHRNCSRAGIYVIVSIRIKHFSEISKMSNRISY
jgi:hypothetical protein